MLFVLIKSCPYIRRENKKTTLRKVGLRNVNENANLAKRGSDEQNYSTYEWLQYFSRLISKFQNLVLKIIVTA